ncbi:7-carboxy-7-deazaguanine synthase [Aureibacter tunicatorum]|nr:7-carboxy-7-deazaguanine synthase [Aureibacter tunicatorum]
MKVENNNKEEEKKMIERGEALPIMESFYTLQGEGFYQGHAAYFIRLGGCDVECFWCDVKESWDALAHPVYQIGQIVEDAMSHNGRLAIVTGGEPLMYDCGPLTKALKDNGFQTNIETSGAHPVTGEWDWVCFSPKKFKKPHESIYAAANELKVVIYNRNDFKWAEQYAELVNDDCMLYMQPEWSKSDEMSPLIISYIQENPKWRLSLQTHKFLNIP